ncbi:hypothetical protein ABEB36_014438 [Hypothenemus hampei]|uniref:THAP-type domain-containing protein n=1 Tax=Hypothenemus hampei TaxID=57062 RepID=A0ABD1E235_HYPHA
MFCSATSSFKIFKQVIHRQVILQIIKMPCCSSINCVKNSANSRMFAFPANPVRRAIWVQNMQRDFIPTSGSRLCENHFEKSQFESNRQDGWKKLKPNAVPTLFDVVLNPPSIIDPCTKKFIYKTISSNEEVHAQEVLDNSIPTSQMEVNLI